jgi:hypothetical protein
MTIYMKFKSMEKWFTQKDSHVNEPTFIWRAEWDESTDEQYDLSYIFLQIGDDLANAVRRGLRVSAELRQTYPEFKEVIFSDLNLIFVTRKIALAMAGEALIEELNEDPGRYPLPFKLPPGYDMGTKEAASSDELVCGNGYVWWKYFDDNGTTTSSTLDAGWLSSCRHCFEAEDKHAEGKCLFSSTPFAPLISGLP